MKERTTRSLLRSVALVGAVAAGATAFGDTHYEWSPAADGTTYWDDAANWATAEYDGADYRLGNNGNEVKFRTAEEVSIDVLFYSGTHTFVADEAAYGLSGTVLNVWAAPWWAGATDLETVLNIGRGTYSFQNIYLNVNTETGGKSATLNLNGGTLAATSAGTSVTGNGTLAIGENGGTFAGAGAISVAITGSGTLTKTGEGELIITGSTDAFKGKIDVQAGSVKLGDDADATVIAAGTVADFNPVYTWTGTGGDNLWSNLNNWLVSGPTGQTVPTAAPGVDSTVVIPEGDGELTLKVAGDDCTGNLTINRNVKFTRNKDNEGICFTSVEGEGYTLTLEGGGKKYLAITGSGNPTLNCNVKITHWVRMTGTSVFKVTGSFSGSGTLNAQGNNGEPGFEFAGDTSGFTGSYTGGLRNGGNRDGTRLYGSARGSATGAWSFGSADDYNRCALRVGNTTYYFGSLNTIHGEGGYGRFNFFVDSKTTLANVTMEIGGRADSTSNFGGTLSYDSNKIVKVGDTSTLNVTLADSKGEIEAQAGYVNIYGTSAPATFTFSGKTAQVYVEKTVGTYGTEEQEVATGEEDDPDTAEDESVTTQSVETFTAWAPTAYGAYQLESEDVTDDDDNVTGTKYYYVTVANDAEGESYYSVAEAFEGVTAKVAENPEFDTTVYLTRSTTEAVVIPVVGYSLSAGEYTVASVAGATGVTVTLNEGVYETSERVATWIGEAGALWSEAANWSSGTVPDSTTVVTFNDGAVVSTGRQGWGGEAGAIVVNGNVTFQYDANMADYSNVACYGDITGEGTLTLARFGIDAGGKAITIDCDVVIENDTAAYATGGHDSWFMNGSFTVNGTTTVTGLLKTFAPTVFVGDVVIEDGGTVTSYGGSAPTFNNVTMTGKSGIYTYAVTYNGALTMGDEAVVSIGSTSQTYGEGFVLSGSGTIVADTQLPGGTLQTNLRGIGGEGNVWTGTCEIKGYTFRECRPDNYANNNSTIAFNNTQVGYFRENSYAMGLKICSGGLRINGDYSRSTTFSGKLSGDGTITTQLVGARGLNLFFTGDVSEFAGGFDLAAENVTAVVFGSTATGSGERIVINDGKAVTLASGKTWSSANVIVNGELTVAGTLDVPDGCIWGNGNTSNKIKFTNDTTALTIEKFASSWNGTYVVGWDPDSSKTHFVVDNYGRSGSKVEIAGVNGKFIALPSTGNAAPSIATEVILTANWTINDGWTAATTTFAKLSGSGNLTVNGASGDVSKKIPYAITTLNEYTGTLGGVRSKFTISNIVKDGAAAGDLLVKAAADATFDQLALTKVNGGSALVEFRSDAEVPGLYWAEKSEDPITVDGATIAFAADGTITATFTEAVESAADVVVKVSGSEKAFGDGYGFKVTLAEGGMSATIEPAVTFAEALEAGEAAWTEGETDVTLNVDVVPGMFYAAASGATLNMARPAASTPATADTEITVVKQTGTQGFYQVWVSAMPIAAATAD